MATQQLTVVNMTPAATCGQARVAVVIPCYKVRDAILGVIGRIGPGCSHIFVVDDACPEGSGKWVEQSCTDPRVTVIFHAQNQGVGGAVVTGYHHALEAGAAVIVKIDGDGQMDPADLERFTAPILSQRADYTKGNRFYNIADVASMPPVRLFGNAGLSFMTKLSSGYWQIFDPTNGYTAISANVARKMGLEHVHKRYFFESDMLFRLGTMRACVLDIPMTAVYGDEQSSLNLMRALVEFPWNHTRNTVKRIFYSYFLRGFSVASLELLLGLGLFAFGFLFGAVTWRQSMVGGTAATSGTVMLSVLPIILGIQFLLAFFAFDVSSAPQIPIGPLLTPSEKDLREPAAHCHGERPEETP